MKKNRSYKTMAMIVCAVLLLLGICGCKGTEEQVEQVENGEHEAITILTGRINYSEFAQLLEETYPEVNLEFINYHGGDTSSYMLETLKHGDIPDIYAITFFPDTQLQQEQLLDLANYSVINEYASTMIDGVSVDGGVYLLPSSYSLLGIVYNKTLLAENGWKVPESFEELKQLAPEMNAAGYTVAGVNSTLTGNVFGSFFGLGNTNYFSTPEGAQWKTDFIQGEAEAVGSLEIVAQYFQEWIDAGLISTYYYDYPEEDANDDFASGKYLFQLNSNNFSDEGTEYEYGFMPFLSQDGTSNMMVRLVNRYYGLNKELGEEGNQQKLEDAIKVLELMATPKGQAALSGGNANFISSTAINKLSEDSPYKEVEDLINSGNMIDMVYAGWETKIVPLMEQYGYPWIRGELSAEDFLKGMDTINTEQLEGKDHDKLGDAVEDISIEDAARLCAIAEGKAVDADVAVITMPGFHGFAEGVTLENQTGVNCGLYKGSITHGTVNIFGPTKGSIAAVRLTGSQIKELVQAGLMVPGDAQPYEFCMVTRQGIELEDETEYTLAIADVELSDEELLAAATITEITPKQAIADYIEEIKTISAESIVWE